MQELSAFDSLKIKVAQMLLEAVQQIHINTNFPDVKKSEGQGDANINTPRGAFYNHFELKKNIDFSTYPSN